MMGKVVIIIQARMTSTRLPGKILLTLGGIPVLKRTIDRCRRSILANKIVLAIPETPESEPLRQFCKTFNIDYCEGSEDDVLGRYYLAAEKFGADTIVRVTSDCPLIEPTVIDGCVSLFQILNLQKNVDYVSNTIKRTFPRGLDVEVFSRKALQAAYSESSSTQCREHVTPYFYLNQNIFSCADYVGVTDYSQYRLTLDTDLDFEMFESFFKRTIVPSNWDPMYAEIISTLLTYPEIAKINAQVEQKKL